MSTSRTTRDLWTRRARAESHHDGDSVTLYIDDGRDRYSRATNARLRGVWAPELREPGGRECREFITDWLEAARSVASNSAWPLVVTTIRTRTDRDAETLGRYVYDVEDEDGHSLNTAIMAFVAEHGYTGGIGAP